MTRTAGMLSLFLLAATTPVLFTGCGGGGTSSETTASTGTQGTKQPVPDGSAVAAQTANGTSAAESPNAEIIDNGVDSEASQCVAIFLDSLRRGDERAANGVLTTKAREELSKTAFVIQPLGTPEGEYKIGRVVFPYPDQKEVALVECTWLEPPIPDEDRLAMEIVCEVHKETEGWRIAGMGVSVPGTEDALVLDFENAASLQATIEAATSPSGPAANAPPAGSPTANGQTAQPPQQVVQQPGPDLPAFPTLPAAPQQQISVDDAAPPQLAYPPQLDAPIER